MEQKEFVDELKSAIKAEKIVIGTERTLGFLRSGELKLIALASNSPEESEIRKLAEGKNVEVITFSGDSIALGKLCKKPFAVAAVSVQK